MVSEKYAVNILVMMLFFIYMFILNFRQMSFKKGQVQ